MTAMVGFVLGYVLGTKAGDNGWAELEDSWRTITSSAEMKDLVTGGLVMVRDLLRQGAGLLADRLSQGDGATTLRSAA